MTPASAEYMVSSTYLEWMTSLPWAKSSGTEDIDIPKAQDILDEDHYDLEKVKQRILDYLAVKKLQPGDEGSDPVLPWAAGSGENFAREIDRARAGPQIRAHFAGRHA